MVTGLNQLFPYDTSKRARYSSIRQSLERKLQATILDLRDHREETGTPTTDSKRRTFSPSKILLIHILLTRSTNLFHSIIFSPTDDAEEDLARKFTTMGSSRLLWQSEDGERKEFEEIPMTFVLSQRLEWKSLRADSQVKAPGAEDRILKLITNLVVVVVVVVVVNHQPNSTRLPRAMILEDSFARMMVPAEVVQSVHEKGSEISVTTCDQLVTPTTPLDPPRPVGHSCSVALPPTSRSSLPPLRRTLTLCGITARRRGSQDQILYGVALSVGVLSACFVRMGRGLMIKLAVEISVKPHPSDIFGPHYLHNYFLT
ncbi:hypothetical protein BDD12DRAFT_808325 [Trichophaea hybrida]|nr:hypothetical protein BDD12DRAFT_808325 [Trichophaea hybrida]